MPPYRITLKDDTINHDGVVEISGGALTLLARGQLIAAYGMGDWTEVTIEGKAPVKEPIPASNNAFRALFEGEDFATLLKLAKLYKTDPQTAAVAAITVAIEAEQAASSVKIAEAVRQEAEFIDPAPTRIIADIRA